MGKARAYTFFALLVALVAFGAARAKTLWDEHTAANRSADALLETWASSTEQYARRTLESADLIFTIVSGHVRETGGVREAGDDPKTHQLLADLARQTIGDYLMLVDATGTPVALSASAAAPRVDLSDRDWFKAHRDRSIDRYVGPSIHSRITNEILFTYSRPIRGDGGPFMGALQTSMKQSFFKGVPISSTIQASAEIAVWRLDGNLIAASNMTPELLQKGFASAGLREAVQRADAGLTRIAGLDGARHAAFRVLPEWGVAVTASIVAADILGQWRKDRRNAVIAYGVLATVLGLLGGFALLSAAREEKLTQRLREKNAALEDALAARDLLIREVHHRVNNNLQIVSSLLRINARRASDVKTLVAITQDRIQVMATMHEVIYKGAVSEHVDLEAYLARLMESVESANALKSRGVRIGIDCAPVTIPMDRLTPVGLIIVEVLSNAAEHGFSGARDGRLRISAHRAAGLVRIEIRNDGAPLDSARKLSWGGRLIDALAVQINGQHHLFQEGDWTVFSLMFEETPATGPPAATTP